MRTKLTPENADKICNLVRAGHYKKVAAAQAGVDERTLYHWTQKADPNHPQHRKKYAEFKARLDQAEADSEIILVDDVLKKGGAREALEILKRRFPERWGDRHRLEHAGPGGDTPIPMEHSGEIAGMAPTVQIVIQNGDAWSEDDEAEAEADHSAAEKARLKAHDDETIHMPSDIEEIDRADPEDA